MRIILIIVHSQILHSYLKTISDCSDEQLWQKYSGMYVRDVGRLILVKYVFPKKKKHISIFLDIDKNSD